MWYLPGLQAYWRILKFSMSIIQITCAAAWPNFCACSAARLKYDSRVLIVILMKSPLLTVCIIPHISKPANGTIITAQKNYIFVNVLFEAILVCQLQYVWPVSLLLKIRLWWCFMQMCVSNNMCTDMLNVMLFGLYA